MPDGVNDAPLGTPVGAEGTPPGAPVSSIPSDYEELKAYRERYEQLASTLEPIVDDIKPLLEDPEMRDFWKSARESYVSQRESRKPQIDPALQPVVERFESQLTPLVEYVNGERAAKEQAKKDAESAAQRANLEYAQRLAAERPDLADDDYAGIGMLAAYAANRGISLEEAWKRKGASLAAPAKRAEPVRSLRAAAAAPGVPGESRQERPTTTKGMAQMLKERIAAGMRG